LEDGVRAYGSFALLCEVAKGFEKGDKILPRVLGGIEYNDALAHLRRDFAECRTPISDQLAAVARLAGKIDDDKSLKPIDWVTTSPLERLGKTAHQLSQALPNYPDPFVKMLNETGIEGRVLGSIGLSLGDRDTNYRRALLEYLSKTK
jgi:hypothetical protein